MNENKYYGSFGGDNCVGNSVSITLGSDTLTTHTKARLEELLRRVENEELKELVQILIDKETSYLERYN